MIKKNEGEKKATVCMFIRKLASYSAFCVDQSELIGSQKVNIRVVCKSNVLNCKSAVSRETEKNKNESFHGFVCSKSGFIGSTLESI